MTDRELADLAISKTDECLKFCHGLDLRLKDVEASVEETNRLLGQLLDLLDR